MMIPKIVESIIHDVEDADADAVADKTPEKSEDGIDNFFWIVEDTFSMMGILNW